MIVKTKDIGEASYLRSSDFATYLGVEKAEGFRKPVIYLVFEVDQTVYDNYKVDYMNGRCKVDPRKFFSCIEEIRTIVRDSLNH